MKSIFLETVFFSASLYEGEINYSTCKEIGLYVYTFKVSYITYA